MKQDVLDAVLAAPRPEGKRLGEVLVERGHVSEAQLIQVLSRQLSVPWVSLQHVDFSRQLLNLVPHAVAEAWGVVPVLVRRGRDKKEILYVATDDPTNEEALEAIREAVKLETRPMIAAASHIREALRVYYGVGQKPGLSDADETPRPSRVAPPPPAPAATAPASGGDAAAEPPPSSTRLPEAGVRDDDVEVEVVGVREVDVPDRKSNPRMVALTMLDGTTVRLPARGTKGDGTEASGLADGLTARDLVAALRAAAQGADASEVLGKDARLEPVVAALLEVLLKKGVFADWELAEALRKKG